MNTILNDLSQDENASHEGIAIGVPPSRRLKLLRFHEIKLDLNSCYLVKGLLDQNALSVVYGDAGSGKSFLALDIALHCALNRPWFGRPVNGGAAIYVAAEGVGGLANRLAAFKKFHCIETIPFGVLPTAIDLCHAQGDTDDLVTLIREEDLGQQPALVVIDTFARVMAGCDENGFGDMGNFIQNVDRIRHGTGAHVLVVHHSGKDPLRGARGHSSLRAAVDTEILVSRAANGISVARVTKQKEAATEGEIKFALKSVDLETDENGEMLRQCVVVPAAGEQSEPQELSHTKQLVLTILERLVREEGRASESEHIPQNVKCVLYEAWKEKCCLEPISTGVEDSKRRAFDRASTSLLELGLVRHHEEWVWLQPELRPAE